MDFISCRLQYRDPKLANKNFKDLVSWTVGNKMEDSELNNKLYYLSVCSLLILFLLLVKCN
jgi:hypothetical protein